MFKNKINHLFVITSLLILGACSKQVTVSVTVDFLDPIVDEDVLINISASNRTAYLYDFGNGEVESSEEESFTYAWDKPGTYLLKVTAHKGNPNKIAHDCIQINVHYDTEKFKGTYPLTGDCDGHEIEIVSNEFDQITLKNLGGFGVDVTGQIGGEFEREILIEKQNVKGESGSYVFFGRGDLLPTDQIFLEYSVRYLDDTDPTLDYTLLCKMNGFKE